MMRSFRDGFSEALSWFVFPGAEVPGLILSQRYFVHKTCCCESITWLSDGEGKQPVVERQVCEDGYRLHLQETLFSLVPCSVLEIRKYIWFWHRFSLHLL